MSATTLEAPAPDLLGPSTKPSTSSSTGQAADAALLTADGKTMHQEAVDSARAAGIALLASAGITLTIVIATVLPILR